MPYLDHAATSPVSPAARQAFLDALDAPLGNASALHSAGHAAKNLVETARAQVAALINADPQEIIFTSGSSEVNNMVINSFAGQTIVASAIEHESVLNAARARAGQLLEIPVDHYGKVDTKAFDGLLAERPALASVMLASNELGQIEPVAQLAEQAHTHGARFHTDATAALGKIPVDVRELGVDYLTISAHKIGGIIGAGALYVRQGAPINPLIIGGSQERGLRSGTYPAPLLAAFGAAAAAVTAEDFPQQFTQKVRPLRDLLAREIRKQVPHATINTNLEESLPNILNCSFAAAEGESIQLYLDLKDHISVSTGSACAAGNGQPSHVLMATHHDAEVAHSSIRFSLGLEVGEKDIHETVRALKETVSYLQNISTIKIKEEV